MDNREASIEGTEDTSLTEGKAPSSPRTDELVDDIWLFWRRSSERLGREDTESMV